MSPRIHRMHCSKWRAAKRWWRGDHLRGSRSGTNHVYAESLIAADRLGPAFRRGLVESDVPLGRLWIEQKLERQRVSGNALRHGRESSGRLRVRAIELPGSNVPRAFRRPPCDRDYRALSAHLRASGLTARSGRRVTGFQNGRSVYCFWPFVGGAVGPGRVGPERGGSSTSDAKGARCRFLMMLRGRFGLSGPGPGPSLGLKIAAPDS